MQKLSSIITIIKIVVKYSAVVVAIIKGIELISDELQKIDLSENKTLKNE
jgi:hypothetical protein